MIAKATGILYDYFNSDEDGTNRMTFDVHMNRLTASVHALTTERTAEHYSEMRRQLKACIAADAELAVPAVLSGKKGEETAMPGMTRASNEFLFYVAYTCQDEVDAAEAETVVSIPIVNFLAIVHENRKDPEVGGIILNPHDCGGCAIVIAECVRLLDEVVELLDKNALDPDARTILQ